MEVGSGRQCVGLRVIRRFPGLAQGALVPKNAAWNMQPSFRLAWSSLSVA
jgi:hypothetical protein